MTGRMKVFNDSGEALVGSEELLRNNRWTFLWNLEGCLNEVCDVFFHHFMRRWPMLIKVMLICTFTILKRKFWPPRLWPLGGLCRFHFNLAQTCNIFTLQFIKLLQEDKAFKLSNSCQSNPTLNNIFTSFPHNQGCTGPHWVFLCLIQLRSSRLPYICAVMRHGSQTYTR